MAEQSNASEHLWLLEGLMDFTEHNLALVKQSRRNIAILTKDLDAALYGSSEFVQALSDFCRANRNANVRILVKDTRTAIATGHPLVRLAQRLSSKILIRKMTVEPNNKAKGFVLFDMDKLLYKNDEGVYRGFANYAAARELKPLAEEFNYLWQYGEAEPEFQILHI